VKKSADYRLASRNALRSCWGIAVIACIIASFLGAVSGAGPELEIELESNDLTVSLFDRPIFSSQGLLRPRLTVFLVALASVLILSLLIMAAARFILGTIVTLGHTRFHLDLLDGTAPELRTLFVYFPHWKTALGTGLLKGLYIFLWSLLFVIPGIIAGYSYAMTDFILAEHPELSPGEALARSKSLMEGHRWELFCLEFSFICWSILCGLTMGLGNFVLEPYRKTAIAAFYRDLSAPPVLNAGPDFL